MALAKTKRRMNVSRPDAGGGLNAVRHGWPRLSAGPEVTLRLRKLLNYFSKQPVCEARPNTLTQREEEPESSPCRIIAVDSLTPLRG